MKKIFFTLLIFCTGIFTNSFAIEEIITLEDNANFKKEFKEGISFEFTPSKPKKILFENAVINEFSPVLNFQGTYDTEISDEKSNFTYPFIIEGGGEIIFNKRKDTVKVVSNFTRNVDDFDNKFLGKLSDVYFEHNLNKNHKVLIGNSRIPIGMEGGKSQYGLMFAKRAQIASSFGNARALGTRFRGKIKYIDYDLGGYSSTRNLQDVTDGIEFAGLINYKPFYNNETSVFKDFKISTWANTGTRSRGYTVSGLGTEWKYDRFLLNAEYAYADGSNASKYNPDKSSGFYTTAAYNITNKIQAALRYDILDLNTKKAGDTVQKYTVGLNYYVNGQRLKFSLDYTFTKNGKTAGIGNNNSIHFTTQIMI